MIDAGNAAAERALDGYLREQSELVQWIDRVNTFYIAFTYLAR
jgi:hypothetical protein